MSKSASLSCNMSWEKRKLRVGWKMKTRAITATRWRLGDFSGVRAHTLPQGEGHAHRSIWREKEGVLIMFLLTITNPTILLVQEGNRLFHRMGLLRIETLQTSWPWCSESRGRDKLKARTKVKLSRLVTLTALRRGDVTRTLLVRKNVTGT